MNKFLKKTLIFIINVYFKVFISWFIHFFQFVNPNSNGKAFFFTFHKRPNFIFRTFLDSKLDYSDYAIIVQGPIVTKFNFTLNTILLYLKLYPKVNLVLSTWENSNSNDLKKFHRLPIKICLNKYPSHSGILNLNFQLISTQSALNNLNPSVKYCLKSRSDTRVFSKNALLDMKNLLEIFPTKVHNVQKRIIGIDINTSKYIPFNFSDLIQFGDVNDMKIYWNCPLSKFNITLKDYLSFVHTLKDYYFNPNPEITLCKNYLDRIGQSHNNTLENYYEQLRKVFLIIDKEMINLYWHKYSIDEFNWSFNYKTNDSNSRLRFMDWVAIFNGQLPNNFDSNIFATQ